MKRRLAIILALWIIGFSIGFFWPTAEADPAVETPEGQPATPQTWTPPALETSHCRYFAAVGDTLCAQP